MADFDRQPKILIVDDVPENIAVLGEVLRPHYRCSVALNGEKALSIAASEDPPDLILLDIMMPGMDGYQVCEWLRVNEATRRIPVIFVTAMGEVEDEMRGFAVGAVDYITKPISPPIVLARVKTHLELMQAREALENQNAILRQKVREHQRVLLKAYEALKRRGRSSQEAESSEEPSAPPPSVEKQYVATLAGATPQTRAALENQEIEIIRFPFQVGRWRKGSARDASSFNDLVIDDEEPYQVSRNHFALDWIEDGISIVDVGSQLGTIVNGERIGGEVENHITQLKEGENEVIAGIKESPFRFLVTLEIE